jgi:hypothetical protein
MRDDIEHIMVVGGTVSEGLSTEGARRLLRVHGRQGGAKGAMLVVVVETLVGMFHLLMGYGHGAALASALMAGVLVGLWMWWRAGRA